MTSQTEFFRNVTIDKNEDKYTYGQIEKEYSQYVINKYLAHNEVFVSFVEMLNNLSLDNLTHYRFLMHSLPKRRIPFSWKRKEKNENLEIITEYYGISVQKAYEILNILTEEQIKILGEKLKKGGKETIK